MEITKRYSRKSRKQNMTPGDRLSALPDDVLCHILSLLLTKHSLATSILSRRWRFLWTQVPCLNFEIEHSKDANVVIENVLSLNNVPNLDTFRVSCDADDDNYDFEKWITIVLDRNIKHLDLYFPYATTKKPIPCLFRCETLVDLRLSDCVGIPTMISLPNLKILHLHFVWFTSDQSLPQILSGCSVLEELKIDNCGWSMPGIELYISSPTIKSLSIVSNFNELHSVVANAPALRFLDVLTCIPISFEDPKSLIEANIGYLPSAGRLSPLILDESYIYLSNVLASLCNVKCLRFSIQYAKLNDIALAESTFLMSSSTRFTNLKNLDLATHGLFLTTFLEAANNLEILIYREVYEDDQKYWKEPQHQPTCLTSHLRSITINCFRFEEHEFELIKYLLRNAKVLEKMKIHSHEWMTKFNEAQIISGFSRGSEACELEFL